MTNFGSQYQNEFHSKLLRDNLNKIFGEFDDTILNEIENQLVWIELDGGKTIIKEGDIGDSLYFVLSGRLVATKKDIDGHEYTIGDIVRGETVGEMAIFTGEPRYATVTAIRDSVLVKLSKPLFEKVIREYSDVALNVTRLIIERIKKTHKPRKSKIINICFLPIHDTVNISEIIRPLYDYCSQNMGICYVNKELLSQNGFNLDQNISEDNKSESKELIKWLNDLELMYDFMFFECDYQTSFWNEKCMRQADHIVLIADSTQHHQLTTIEQELRKIINVNFSIVLVHPKDTEMPNKTIEWLNIRPLIKNHYHLRLGLDNDLQRLGRILTGRATGLVLAGGGAKGFAHIGVLRALKEYQIPIDYIGGTSVGSMMAATFAFDKPSSVLEETIYEATIHKPSSDFSLIPLISLVKGLNIKRMVNFAIKHLSGHQDTDITDTWIPMYVVASNYTRSNESVFFRGNMAKILLASSAIPGVFPPVIIDGEMYVDGGTFNNFPADIMRNLDLNKVIGIDFMLDKNHKLTIDEMPTNNQILRSKLMSSADKKYRLPSIGSIIINSTLMYSNAKRHESIAYLDLHFNPDVAKYGITAWTDYHKIVEKGYQHGKQVLEQMSIEELAKYQNPMAEKLPTSR
jgi:NTE family protein